MNAPASQPAHTNRLIHASSPYLLQHAHNPVDWHEWGPEALARARDEDKPIFLSIGYSACHWCHVMAHESFEDEATAAVMNRLFVNIKVDREERPDLDDLYMQATMIVNQGQGGWPMSVWLTPDLQPFFAGTYFPPESRWGRPGFRDLCERIGELWRANREDITADAKRLTGLVRQSLDTAASQPATLDVSAIDAVVAALADAFDEVHGGISGGGTNKFPPSLALDLFLRCAARTGGDARMPERLRRLVDLTLTRMARGGVYDQVGGGIHRYSTDVQWLVPHFEKMLYDQALVSRIYVDAWQATKNPEYRRVAVDIFDYVLGDLQSPDGGFYSSRDADSEGEEGRYYVWTRDEVLAALGPRDGELFCSYFDVSEAGNWRDPHAPGVAKNILHAPRELEAVAKLNRTESSELERTLAVGRAMLREARARRVPPHRDEKILAEWNGLMISALTRGGAALGEPKYVTAAERGARFVLGKLYAGGRLVRSYRDGRRLESGFLTDYAAMIEALIELYEATFERSWLEQALELNAAAMRRFYDLDEGGFFFTADDHEPLLARAKDVRDGATPSGNSVQLMNLLRLSAMTGDAALREAAERTIRHVAPHVAARAGMAERFLAAVEFARLGPVEVAIAGDPALPATQALLRAVRESYLPNRIIMLADPADPSSAFPSPLLMDRPLVNGQPAAYVCRNYTCLRPATSAAELTAQLSRK
ncbi:MAG: thioredoxin domain-containing protein [Phycisphaerae bacterium]